MIRRKLSHLWFSCTFAAISAAWCSPAAAHSYTITYGDGCCCEDVVDCTTLLTSNNPVCNVGHKPVEGSLRACGRFEDYLGGGKCEGVGCFGHPNACFADIGPRSILPDPPPIPQEDLHNGLDDDCDRLVDECVPGNIYACTRNVRSCGGLTGTEVCASNARATNECVVPGHDNPDYCPKAACRGGIIDDTDTDGDGLFDCWEDEGIDYNGDGTIDLPLPGANKLHRDVFVEADYFDCAVAGSDCQAGDTHTHEPQAAAIAMVVASYAAAPVANHDGVSGITLHVQIDEAVRHQEVCDIGPCYASVKDAYFGSASDRADPVVRLAKRLAYRYSVWAHDIIANESWSGRAPSPSADLVISLGHWAGKVGTTHDQAVTFMHELGHTFGLQHGGDEENNYKPNYLSVMNYRFDPTGLMPGNLLDYSRAALPTLTETSLSEPAGIGDGTFIAYWFCPGGSLATGIGNGPLNWDCLPPPNMATDLGVSVDLNGDRACIGSGADGILQSAVQADDQVAGGVISAGPNATLQTVLKGDDLFRSTASGLTVVPGFDGMLQSVPGGDDELRGQEIWDGPDRTCQSVLQADDDKRRELLSVEPPLRGFDDWQALRYEFVDLLRGYGISHAGATLPPEMDRKTAELIERQSHVADLAMGQTLTRDSDGRVVIRLDLQNLGPDLAVGPTISAPLPSSLVFKSCSVNAGGRCNLIGGNDLAISFDSFGGGQGGSATIVACTTSGAAIDNPATVTASSTDPRRDNDTALGHLSAPISLPATQLPNGDMRYAVTFASPQAYVEAFVRQNGVQNVAGNIAGSRVANADGTFTYSRVVPAASYRAGDVINVRFYSYRTGQLGVFTPGPVEWVSYPDFIYGTGSTTCSNACRPTFAQLADGSVKITTTFAAPQSNVEAFVRANTRQVAAGSIVQSSVANFDGTFTYTRVVPASAFRAGDRVTYRIYSNVAGQPPAFRPGPTQSAWFDGFTYGRQPMSDCP